MCSRIDPQQKRKHIHINLAPRNKKKTSLKQKLKPASRPLMRFSVCPTKHRSRSRDIFRGALRVKAPAVLVAVVAVGCGLFEQVRLMCSVHTGTRKDIYKNGSCRVYTSTHSSQMHTCANNKNGCPQRVATREQYQTNDYYISIDDIVVELIERANLLLYS